MRAAALIYGTEAALKTRPADSCHSADAGLKQSKLFLFDGQQFFLDRQPTTIAG